MLQGTEINKPLKFIIENINKAESWFIKDINKTDKHIKYDKKEIEKAQVKYKG